MAVNNTEKSYSKMEFPMAMQRQDAFALDPTEIWPSLDAAQTYAQSDPTAYVWQKLAVIVNGVSQQYQIKNVAGDLEPLGGVAATDAEVEEMFNDVFGSNT